MYLTADDCFTHKSVTHNSQFISKQNNLLYTPLRFHPTHIHLFSPLNRIYSLDIDSHPSYIYNPPPSLPYSSQPPLSAAAHVNQNGSQPATLLGYDLHCRRRRQRPVSGHFAYRNSRSTHPHHPSSHLFSATSSNATSGFNSSAGLRRPSPCGHCSAASYSSSYPRTSGRRSSPCEHAASSKPSAGCSSSSFPPASVGFSSAPHPISAPTGCTHSSSACFASSFRSSSVSVHTDFSGAFSVAIEPSGTSHRSSGAEPPWTFSSSVSHRSEWSKCSGRGVQQRCFGLGFALFGPLDFSIWAFSICLRPTFLYYALLLSIGCHLAHRFVVEIFACTFFILYIDLDSFVPRGATFFPSLYFTCSFISHFLIIDAHFYTSMIDVNKLNKISRLLIAWLSQFCMRFIVSILDFLHLVNELITHINRNGFQI